MMPARPLAARPGRPEDDADFSQLIHRVGRQLTNAPLDERAADLFDQIDARQGVHDAHEIGNPALEVPGVVVETEMSHVPVAHVGGREPAGGGRDG